MGGKIRIYSKENQGTIAFVTLPYKADLDSLYKMNCKFLNQSQLKRMKSLKQKNIMIVEDLPFNAQINESYVKKCGGEVMKVAENGRVAVESYKDLIQQGIEIDLICMDIEMPVMNGKEAVREIRKFEQQMGIDHCCVVFLSGNTLKSEMDECLNENGDIRGQKFLRKPLKFEEFETTYKEMFGQRR